MKIIVILQNFFKETMQSGIHYFFCIWMMVSAVVAGQSPTQSTKSIDTNSGVIPTSRTPSPAVTNIYVQRVLILGDSHVLGFFGEQLQRKIHESGTFDILSFAIGGAGSRNYTMTMRNNCCGYKIRESYWNEDISGKKPIRVIESCNYLSEELIGKKYKGRIQNVLKQYDPHVIVIALGHNYINDHQNLVNLIYSYNQNIEIVWVAPFKNRYIDRQMYSIQQVVKNNPVFLVRSDDIIGSDTAVCAHYSGRAVTNWATKVVERMQPVLKKSRTKAPQYVAREFSSDSLPVFRFFYEDYIFSLFESYVPPVFSVLLPSVAQLSFAFSPRYLDRLYSVYDSNKDKTRSMTDADGNIYEVIWVGNQCWTMQNLRTTSYRNGNPIQKGDPNSQYFFEESPALYFQPHQNKNNSSDGLLYTWYAVNSNDQLCPDGWHVPDDTEWNELFEALQEINFPAQGNTLGLNSDGRFFAADDTQYWWTRTFTEDGTQSAWAIGYNNLNNSFTRINRNTKCSFPVRCIKD